MDKLSKEQFNQVMGIVKSHLTRHADVLIQDYGYSSKLEWRIETLESEIKQNLKQITDLDD